MKALIFIGNFILICNFKPGHRNSDKNYMKLLNT